MQSITLDLIPQEVKPILRVSQYDDNWDVKIFITENGEALGVSPSDMATLIIRKPDDNIVTLEAVAAYSDAFKVTLTEQACACYGDSFGELIIEATTGGVTRRKGTCNFILSVEISPELGGIDSQSEIDNLESQIESITSNVIEEVAPPIIAEMLPTIVGDEYYTKTEIDNNFYSKTQIDTNYYTKEQTDEAIAAAGSAYTETVLFNNTDDSNLQILNIGDSIVIDGDFTSYDELIVIAAYRNDTLTQGKQLTHFGQYRLIKDTLLSTLANYGSGEFGQLDCTTHFIIPSYYLSWVFKMPDVHTLYINQKNVSGWNNNYVTITKIIGVKY